MSIAVFLLARYELIFFMLPSPFNTKPVELSKNSGFTCLGVGKSLSSPPLKRTR